MHAMHAFHACMSCMSRLLAGQIAMLARPAARLAGQPAANVCQWPPMAVNGRANGRQWPPMAANGRKWPPMAASMAPSMAANGRQWPRQWFVVRMDPLPCGGRLRCSSLGGSRYVFGPFVGRLTHLSVLDLSVLVVRQRMAQLKKTKSRHIYT